jgi:hypothetical protein
MSLPSPAFLLQLLQRPINQTTATMAPTKMRAMHYDAYGKGAADLKVRRAHICWMRAHSFIVHICWMLIGFIRSSIL